MDGKETYCSCEKYVQSAKGVIMMSYSHLIGLCVCACVVVAYDIFISQDYSDLFFHVFVFIFALLILGALVFGGDFIGIID